MPEREGAGWVGGFEIGGGGSGRRRGRRSVAGAGERCAEEQDSGGRGFGRVHAGFTPSHGGRRHTGGDGSEIDAVPVPASWTRVASAYDPAASGAACARPALR
jgi:hypothetical protein